MTPVLLREARAALPLLDATGFRRATHAAGAERLPPDGELAPWQLYALALCEWFAQFDGVAGPAEVAAAVRVMTPALRAAAETAPAFDVRVIDSRFVRWPALGGPAHEYDLDPGLGPRCPVVTEIVCHLDNAVARLLARADKVRRSARVADDPVGTGDGR